MKVIAQKHKTTKRLTFNYKLVEYSLLHTLDHNTKRVPV